MTEPLPAVFLPYQQELLRAVSRNALTVVEKSRRTGYTWTIAAVAVLEAMKAGGQNVFYTAYNEDIGREFIRYCAKWAKDFQAAASAVEELVLPDPDRPDSTIWVFRVKFASTFEILALPSVPRAIRGRQGLVILDEAAFMTDLPGMLTAAYALLIWGGRIVVISTHFGADNPFNELIQEIRSGKRTGVVLRVTFDEAQAQGLYKRICLQQRNPWTQAGEDGWRAGILGTYSQNADEELHVIPSAGTGAYLPLPLIRARQADASPVIRWEAIQEFENWPEGLRRNEVARWCDDHLLPVLEALPAEPRHALGGDIARRGDLTVFVVASIEKNLMLKWRFVVEIRRMPFRQQEQVLFYILDRLRNWRAALDATGIGMQLSEAATDRYGSRVTAVTINDGWYRLAMPPYKAAFEDGLIEIPRDDGIEDDHRALKLVRGVAKVPDATRDAEGNRRHGDSAIAGCLSLFASMGEVEIYGYDPVGRPGGGQQGGGWHDKADDWDDDNTAPAGGGLPALRGGAFV